MEKKQQNFRSQNPSPPPYESSISSFSPSSFSRDGEGPEHSLHPSPAPQKEISRKQSTKRTGDDQVLKKVNFWFRVFGFLFCLISFSIMAADRDKGWTLDSFHRYIEFRYCLTVNVIGFIYSALQGFDLAYQLFSSDATRVEDWRSNWGKDKFPNMANASVAVSFMAFVSLASSSLISGYTICTL
ncbi:CASP-like protein 4A1 isoform X2 [Daucus carota subsp. sativus]|uniref:CASP-like protein 4A1 isoform X2 n=1 Tax=Daucus carota subsp. sativus TaxID=79200 RepID=UPI00308331ED